MLSYAFICVDRVFLENIFNKIKNFGPSIVNKVNLVYGEYDIVLKIKSPSKEKINSIFSEIRNMEGVKLMRTALVSHKHKETDVLPCNVDELNKGIAQR